MILIILFYHDRMSCSDAHRVAFFFFPSIQITCTIHQISLFSLILIHRIYGKLSVTSFCVSLFSMIITIIT